MREKIFIANLPIETLAPAPGLDFIFWKQMDWAKVALRTKSKRLCQWNLNHWKINLGETIQLNTLIMANGTWESHLRLGVEFEQREGTLLNHFEKSFLGGLNNTDPCKWITGLNIVYL